MVTGLGQTLQVIERHKNVNPQFSELLDILGEILILREEHRKKITKSIFPIDEAHLEAKLQGGLPLVDFSSEKLDLDEPKKFFIALLEIGQKRNPVETEQILKDIEDGKLNYEAMVYDSFALTEESEESDSTQEADDDTIDLLKFFVEESLRPSLEFVTGLYGERITKMGWNDGYCPVCGRMPKIGRLVDAEGKRHLFCSQCGFEWRFRRVKCPFCGNEEQQSLSYFTVEGDERYRVDVCDVCKRYIKTVDFRSAGEEAILDVEDVATLHLDMLAHEEGYN
ncbi:MAG TPA: formate dehydrogenase accessory protein FdhE [Syntrophales bacterium]|nr:formate dehydrogenase accessory protein FdhE [Syntrophales bacterium]